MKFLAKWTPPIADFIRSANHKVPAKEAIDAILFEMLMNDLRKSYGPTGHEGSQEGVTDSHRRFALSMETAIKNIDDRFGDEDDEEE